MYTRTFTLAGPASPVAYTVPAGRAALIKSLHLSNTTTATVDVTVVVTPTAGPAFKLIQSGALPKGSALNVIEGTLVLLPGDALSIHTPGATGDVHATLSLMEVEQ